MVEYTILLSITVVVIMGCSYLATTTYRLDNYNYYVAYLQQMVELPGTYVERSDD